MTNHKEKLIIVTGASGGVGSGVVEHLLASGYTDIACQYYTNPARLIELFEFYGRDFKLHCFQGDMTKPLDVGRFHVMVNDAWSIKPWGIINLAGGSTNLMSWKMSLEDFKNIIDVNLTSTFLVSREFIPEMRAQAGGRIINTSSVVASAGTIGAAHYCAAKAGIEGFSRALALELANKHITVNTMALGYFDTGLITHLSPQLQDNIREQTPVKRFGRPFELGGFIDFMLNDSSAFMTGQTLHVNGGYYLR